MKPTPEAVRAFNDHVTATLDRNLAVANGGHIPWLDTGVPHTCAPGCIGSRTYAERHICSELCREAMKRLALSGATA